MVLQASYQQVTSLTDIHKYTASSSSVYILRVSPWATNPCATRLQTLPFPVNGLHLEGTTINAFPSSSKEARRQ